LKEELASALDMCYFVKLEMFLEPAFSILELPSFEILSEKSFYPVKKKILS
jgi:hypothetical protein